MQKIHSNNLLPQMLYSPMPILTQLLSTKEKKAWPSALKSFRTVLQIDPQYARGYPGLATVYESVDSTHLAINAYRQFLDQTEEDKQGRTHAEQRIAHLESKY